METLFYQCFGKKPLSVEKLAGAGSNRTYYRLRNNEISVIGVVGTSVAENSAFIYLDEHFHKKGLPVPKLLAKSTDNLYYLQEDLGDVSLFDAISAGRTTGIFSEAEKALLHKTIRQLPAIQLKGAEQLDFSYCYPQPEFTQRSVRWDLNYFKYCFLKATGLEFQEDALENDFDTLAEKLVQDTSTAFMYRDFQSRNVMIKDGEPFFIDFQGGRKGPLAYDVVSFLWQAKACFSPELREELLQTYFDALSEFTNISETNFRKQLKFFVLFRTLQVLGAYGFRGYFERKEHFLQSIPFAIANLRDFLATEDTTEFPYLASVLKEMVSLEMFREKEKRSNLMVKVYSFSYKKGIPADASGNGGGFVFDCRAVHNPGRYKEYVQQIGLDKPVIDFLENDGEICTFLNHVYGLVDASIERYKERGFTDLQISFGCTGGRHRSVYSAQKTAEHISTTFNVDIHLVHREQGIESVFTKK